MTTRVTITINDRIKQTSKLIHSDMEEAFVYDCIVIGGGFAGLVATRDLSSLGYRVLLLEASPSRIGGRAYTAKSTDNGIHQELGAEWFDKTLMVKKYSSLYSFLRLSHPLPLSPVSGLYSWV